MLVISWISPVLLFLRQLQLRNFSVYDSLARYDSKFPNLFQPWEILIGVLYNNHIIIKRVIKLRILNNTIVESCFYMGQLLH